MRKDVGPPVFLPLTSMRTARLGWSCCVGAQGLCYATLSMAFLAEGLVYLAFPHLSLLALFGYPASAASTFVWRTSGCYLVALYPAVTYSLKVSLHCPVLDACSAKLAVSYSPVVTLQIAADASKLGSRHAQTLNASLLGSAMAHLAVSEMTPFHLQAHT